VNLPALASLTEWIADEVRRARPSSWARTDLDAGAFADGAETLLVGLLMAVIQVGGSTEPRRQVGVVTIWDRLLRPTPAPVPPIADAP
jgi:hypothetical protein